EAVEEEGLLVNTETRTKEVLPADTVVLATGAVVNQELYRELSGRVSEIYLVGDCVEPRCIFEAIAEGFDAGRAI
ncbi:unnamed protein product, partial [marine sediment metagenome]